MSVVIFVLGFVSGGYLTSIWIHDKTDNVFKIEQALLDECHQILKFKATLSAQEAALLKKIRDYFSK